MIVFTHGGNDQQVPVQGRIAGMAIEEVVLDYEDFAELSQASDEQLRIWVSEMRTNFIPPKRTR